MTLFKTSFWTGLSTGIKLISNFIVAKVLVLYVGPVGFALIGQFQNFISMALIFSGNMVQTGVVKYISEFKDQPSEKTKILSTAFFIALVSSFLIMLILWCFQKKWSVMLLGSVHFHWLIALLGFTLIFYVLNSLLISILNGEREVKRMTLANMANSVAGLILTFFLVKYFGLAGALVALILNQSLVFFITLGLVLKTHWFRWQNFNQGLNRDYFKKLLKFAGMSITSALTLPLAQIFIREYIAYKLSWQDAGYWQAITRISDAYLLLIASTLAVYYLPKLSSLHKKEEIVAEMKAAYRLVIPIVILIALLIYIFKKPIILILFSPQFLPMESLFLFQLIGDVFKICSWLISYNMLAKAMTRLFIFSEIGFSLGYCLFAFIFIKLFGLPGVTLAFGVNYLIYFLFIKFMFSRM